MYTHLLLISTVQIPRAYCSFFYYNIFIVSEQVFLRFFMNLSRHARICNSSHHLQKATEKVLFAYKLAQNKVHQSTLRYYIQYTKTVFQWRPYRGEGILATVVKDIIPHFFYFLCAKIFSYRNTKPCTASHAESQYQKLNTAAGSYTCQRFCAKDLSYDRSVNNIISLLQQIS